MDFKKLVGKQVVWAGEFPNKETDCVDSYVLFNDGTVSLFPDTDSQEPPTALEDGIDVLTEHLKDALGFAHNVLELKKILDAGFVPPPPPDQEQPK